LLSVEAIARRGCPRLTGSLAWHAKPPPTPFKLCNCCAEWLYYYLKKKQKLDVSSEDPSSRVSSLLTLDEGPSLETSSFCLYFKVVI
jgi:hypothetical protein